MDLFSGYPYWLIKTGLPFEYPSLEESIHADVVIMGGGISGSLLGYHLVSAGVDCVLVDARTIGLGSTGASTSLLLYDIDQTMVKLSKKIGEQNAEKAYKISEAAVKTLETLAAEIGFKEFEKKQSLFFAAEKSHVETLKKEYSIRKAAGFPVQFLNTSEIRDQYGFSAPGGIRSGVAAQTNAYAFTHALHQAAIKKGLRVFDRTAIIRIEEEKEGVSLQTAKKTVIKAGKLIYANGYEATRYIDKKIVDLYSTYVCMSEPCDSNSLIWRNADLLWNTADPYLYIRATKERRIAIGGRDEKYSTLLKQNERIFKKTTQLAEDFCKLFPTISFRPEFKWTGIFGTTKDGLPYIGNYKKKAHSYFALGYGGNGITFSLIAAEIITALIVKGYHPDEKLFSFDR